MNLEVKCCGDCPFIEWFDDTEQSWCEHPRTTVGVIPDKIIPVGIPSNCPLITESITVTLLKPE